MDTDKILQKYKNIKFSYNDALNLLVKSCIGFKPTKVYDPICGSGELLALFDDDVEKFGDDICEENIEEAKKNVKNFNGVAGDTLKMGNYASVQNCKKFDCIVSVFPDKLRNKKATLSKCNIIFAELPCKFKLFDLYDSVMEGKYGYYYDSGPETPMKYNKDFFNIDYEYAYLLHILCHLKDDGVAVVACNNNILYNSDFVEFKIRKLMFEKCYIDKIIKLPPSTIGENPYCVLILRKNRDNSKVIYIEDFSKAIYIEDLDRNREEMSLDEIKRNDYCIY